MTNYYHVLGLNEDATQVEIKAAFKKLAVKYHPDKHAGRVDMEEKFKEVNQAYQVLSDPYEKSRFDLKLKYQQFADHQPQTNPFGYQRTHGHRKRYYAPPRVDYKTNARATLYAFAFTFVIALVVMIGIWAKESYDAKKFEERMEARRALYMEARTSFNNGDFHDAFDKMSNFKHFVTQEKDIRLFKESMIDAMISFGDQYYFDQDYEEAIRYYELIQEFQPDNPFFPQKKRLAYAYKVTNQTEKSIGLLEEFLLHEFELIGTIAELAAINKEILKDYKTSKEYYDLGHNLAVKRYKRFYGEGYPLVIKAKYLPESHYRLYAGLADNYLRMENYRMAIKAADWNKYVWPDSAEAYIVTGDAYLRMNELDKACEEYIEAMNLGWNGDRPIDCF
jgi:curved DNA-binding protein CbpA